MLQPREISSVLKSYFREFFTMIIFFTDEPNLNMRVISDLKPNELDPFLMILNVHCEDFIS